MVLCPYTSPYRLIGKCLQQFDNNELTLDRLIHELEVLLETFPNSDEKWKEKFRSEWWTLEQVYAVACDRGETTLNPENEKLYKPHPKKLLPKRLITIYPKQP
jgi:hypothetical protein